MKTVNFKEWFIAVFLINFCINLGFCMSDAFFSIYYSGIGATAILLGASAASYQLSKIIFSRFIGMAVERYGLKSVLFFSLALYSLVAVFFLFMQGLYVIIVLRIIQGIACASFRPVIYGMLDSKVNSHSLDKGRSFGIFDISFYAALAVGPCLGGLIKDTLGFRWLFIALCILCAIAIAIYKYFIINDKYNFINENPVYSDENISKAEYSLYFFIMGKSVMLACMTIFFPIFLVNETHLSSLKVGIILAIPATMMSIFLKPMGDLADKETNGLFVFIGGIMTSTAYLLFPLIDSFNDAIIFTAFCGFFSAMSQPSSVTLLLNNVSPNTSVEAVGRLNSVMGIGYAVGAFFCSILTKYVPIKDIFVNSGIIGLVSMCSFILFLNTKTFFFVTKWFVSKE